MTVDLRDEPRHPDAFALGRRLVSCPEADLRGGLDTHRAGRDAKEIFGLMLEEHRQVLVHLAGRVWFRWPQGARLQVRLPALLRLEQTARPLLEEHPASELWERARHPGCLPERQHAQV